MIANCLNLTRSGEYAIAALTRLALESAQAPATLVPVRVLADWQRLPKSFLVKILDICRKSGLITAKSGPRGGVALARPAAEISLLDVLEACEGAYRRDDCVFYSDRPCTGADCVVFCPLRRREEDVRQSLARTTLAEMARSLEAHPFNESPKSEQQAARYSQGGR